MTITAAFLFRLCLLMSLFPALALASGESFHPVSDIRATALHYLQQRLGGRDEAEITIDRLDRRIHMAPCSQPLEGFSPPGARESGKTTVGVRCGGEKPWSLFVPAHIGLMADVVVVRRDISRGSAIGIDDVMLTRRETGALHRGYFTTLASVVGKTARRTIRRGKVVTANLLVAQKSIRRGDEVTIMAGAGVISVRMKGRALGSGNPGDQIKVENLTTHKRLRARVVKAGLVRTD